MSAEAPAAAAAPKPASKAAGPEKKIKKKEVVVFQKEGLEKLKRKQLQSLAKRTGSKANLNNDELRKYLAGYYDDNKAAITKLAEERKAKKDAKKPRKRKMTDELKSTLNWGKRTDID